MNHAFMFFVASTKIERKKEKKKKKKKKRDWENVRRALVRGRTKGLGREGGGGEGGC